MSKQFTRRDFLKGVAVGAAVVAAEDVSLRITGAAGEDGFSRL